MGATLVVWQFPRRAYRFDGLDMAGPGLVPVQEWRPRSAAEAGARPAMWGGVGRKR